MGLIFGFSGLTARPGIHKHSIYLNTGNHVMRASLEDLWIKVGSYIAIVACFSSPALHSISATAKAKHFLLVVLEGLNLLRIKEQLSRVV